MYYEIGDRGERMLQTRIFSSRVLAKINYWLCRLNKRRYAITLSKS